MENVRFIASDGIVLQGAIYEPSRPKHGTVSFFTPGWSAKYSDYEPLLLPLAERYRVIAFNPRGHGGSGGVLDRHRCIEDLVELHGAYGEERCVLLGHSLAALSLAAAQRVKPKGIVLFNPYVSAALLPRPLRSGVKLLSQHQDSPAVRIVDDILGMLPLDRFGLNMRRPLINTAALNDIEIRRGQRTEAPLLYFVADRDTTTGAHEPSTYGIMRNALHNLSAAPEDASALAHGLNHCMNRSGYVPFLKPGAERENILDRVHGFLGKHLG